MKHNNIKNWILKNGYSFEMIVAKSFKKFAFNVSQSILYKDKNTEKYREIDIIAHINHEINNVWFNLTFVVECKKTIDKPWIVFKNKELFNLKSSRYDVLCSNNAKSLLSKINPKSKELELIFPSIIDSGYNVVTAFKENKDLSYSAKSSLLNACEHLVNKSNQSNLRFCNIYIPIIAIEGELYDAFLDVDEDIKLIKVDYSTIVNTKSFDDTSSSVITIVSSENLETYIENLKKNSESFFKQYIDEMEEISISKPIN